MKAKINFKSKLSRFKNIKSKNKAFDALSDDDKKREIAYDTLMLVNTKVIRASRGFYWDDKLNNLVDNSVGSKNLFENLNNCDNIAGCEVCARGAMMLSMIRLGNKLNPFDYGLSKGTYDILTGFTMEEFYDMEREFEHSSYGHPYKWNTDEKLMNICCNVIANGTFNIYDETNYLEYE